MRVYDNEIIVHRNETFTIDREIVNRDGSPYIVSSRMGHPYFLLTVSDSIYFDEDAYTFNNWLDLKDTLRFHSTNPVNLRTVDSIGGDWNDWDDITTVPDPYYGDDGLIYANDAVFYLEKPTGIEYKYFKYNKTDHSDGDHSGYWVDYKCTISYPFSKEDTSQWIEQTYYYSILLVDGPTTNDYLQSIVREYDLNPPSDILNDNIRLYEFLLDQPEIDLTGINPMRPLSNYSTVLTILEPTKISVLSNLKGEM